MLNTLLELRSINRKVELIEQLIEREKYHEALDVIHTTRGQIRLLLRTASPTDDSAGELQ